MVNDSSVVAHTFQSDEVAFGDVASVKLDAGVSLLVRLHLRIPVERRAMVCTHIALCAFILWRVELHGRTIAQLTHADKGRAVFGS